jgi:hypothetical protein
VKKLKKPKKLKKVEKVRKLKNLKKGFELVPNNMRLIIVGQPPK